MEELTTTTGFCKKNIKTPSIVKFIEKTLIKEYEDPKSPAFGKKCKHPMINTIEKMPRVSKSTYKRLN